jgi:hypothetical protein
MRQAGDTDGPGNGRVGAWAPLLDAQKAVGAGPVPIAPPVFVVQMRRLASRGGPLAFHARLAGRHTTTPPSLRRSAGEMSPPSTTRSVCQVRSCPYTAYLPGVDVMHGDATAPTQLVVLLCDAHRIESNRTQSQTWLEDNIPGLGS